MFAEERDFVLEVVDEGILADGVGGGSVGSGSGCGWCGNALNGVSVADNNIVLVIA